MLKPGTQLDIQEAGGGHRPIIFCPLLNISRGGQEKNVFHSNLKKTTLPIQDIFREKFVFGGMIIQFVANVCGKNHKLYFRGKFFLADFF